MQFALMIYHSPEEFAMRKTTINDPQLGAGRLTTRRSSGQSLCRRPMRLSCPETGTTLRLRDGKRRVQDGPYADTKGAAGGIHHPGTPLPLTPP